MMNDEMYLKTMQRLLNLSGLMSRLDLVGFLERLNSTEEDKPVVDVYLFAQSYHDPEDLKELAAKALELKTMFRKKLTRRPHRRLQNE